MADLDPSKRCRTCRACINQHDEVGVGLCVKHPPTPFVMGMVPVAPAIVREGAQMQTQPVIRAYYPMVNLVDGCLEWEADEMQPMGRA